MARIDNGVRVDLHLHSRASGSATNVWVKGLGDEGGVRESYTPPEGSYRMAKRAGMDFVTLTDHETIDGAVTLPHQPDFLVGEEFSACFPEDGSSVDILLYGLDARSHAEAQDRRGSVYDLVEYLREAGIVHVLAHPMYSVAGPMDRVATEKRLVLFGLWEFVNGSRPAHQNRLAREAAESVGAVDLRQLALRHGLRVPDHTRIAGTGGSDDHGGIYGGATFTVLPGVASREELLLALAAGESEPGGEDGSVGKVTHTAFRLAGAALEEGREGRAVRVLSRFELPQQVLRLAKRASPTQENKLLQHVPALARLDEARIRSALASRYEKHVAGALRVGRETSRPQKLAYLTLLPWALLLFFGSRTSLTGFPQRFGRDLGIPLAILAALGFVTILRSLGARRRPQAVFLASLVVLLAGSLVGFAALQSLRSASGSSGQLTTTPRIAAAGEWLEENNSGGNIIVSPHANQVPGRMMLAMGDYSAVQSFERYQISNPRDLPPTGPGPPSDVLWVVRHPDDRRTDRILRAHDVSYIVLYKSMPDRPTQDYWKLFEGRLDLYRTTFENSDALIVARRDD